MSHPPDTLADMETGNDRTAWSPLDDETPRHLATALRVASMPKRSVRAAHRSLQRARRGWSADDAWQLDAYISGVLGGGLLHLADNADCYPATGHYADHAAWTRELRAHGEALLRWSDLVRTAANDGEDAEYAAAQAALHWVAENLRDLWD